MRLGSLLCTCIVVGFATAARAESTCSFPLASKQSVALAIFNAVADGVETRERRSKYVVIVHDESTKWSVFETLRDGGSVSAFAGPTGHQMETVTSALGGGGLGMYIDKCTAVISDALFQK
jgi:hypothetical protein